MILFARTNIIYLTAITIAVSGALLWPMLLSAQTQNNYLTPVANQVSSKLPPFESLTDVSGTPFATIFAKDATLSGFFNTLFNVSIKLGALLAVLMIAYAGWEWMTTDVANKKGAAKKRIQNALIGLLMLLSTVLVLRQINPDIVSLRLFDSGGTQSQQSISYTPTSGRGGGVSTYSPAGQLTTSPFGYCAQTATGGYLCFDSMANCVAGAQTTQCDAYTIDDPLDYAFVWETGNSCSSGDRVSSGYCGGGVGGGVCCAISAQSAIDADGSAAAGNNWCYEILSSVPGEPSTFSCTSSKGECEQLYANETALITKACALTPVPAGVFGYPEPQVGQICGDTGDTTIAPETRYACEFPSVAVCETAQNGTLTNCKQY